MGLDLLEAEVGMEIDLFRVHSIPNALMCRLATEDVISELSKCESESAEFYKSVLDLMLAGF